MDRTPAPARDPIGWCAALALAFVVLVAIRLTIPSALYFDEEHYVPAARTLLAGSGYPNPEHPLLGKLAIAAGIALFGDGPLGWRLPSLLAGGLTLFAAMRALWFASFSRFATLAYGVLLASGFHLFVHARIAMLDGVMAALLAVGYWQLAAAWRACSTANARWRLAGAGIALGLAMGAKWNAVPLAALPGLAFLAVRLSSARERALTARDGPPAPGISLIEAAVWLGVVPLLAYWLTFAPGYAIETSLLARDGIVALQAHILDLQGQVIEPHPYMSNWLDWMLNRRAIWYLYEVADGAQRGVMLIGNPLTMLAGLPALVWCAWAAVARCRTDCGAVAVIYAAAIGFWIVAPKPIQFAYHYVVPSIALLAALALALEELRRRDLGWAAWGTLAGSLGLFAFFFPILSAAPLAEEAAFLRWTWIEGWR